MRKLALILLLIGSSALAAHSTEMRLPLPEVQTLSNGLTVAWFLDPKIPLIDFQLMIPGGTRSDPPGKSGTAQLMISAMDRGSGGRSAQEFARAVEKLGAQHLSNADSDAWMFSIHGLSEDAAALAGLLADWVLRPTFAPQEVEREKKRELERWSHIQDYSDGLAALAAQRLVLSGTPYARGDILSAAEFSRLNVEDVLPHWKRYFVPKGSVLMVIGNADRAAVSAQIAHAFGAWAQAGPSPVPPIAVYADSRLPKSGTVVVDRPGPGQAHVRLAFKAPLLTSGDRPALIVANAILGENFNSRLTQLVRDKLGLTYSISSAFHFKRDAASWQIVSSTRGPAVGQLIRKIQEVLVDLRRGPISEQELQQAKNYIRGSFPLANATLSAVASRWLGTTLLGLRAESLNRYLADIEAVTVGQVLQALEKHLDLKKAHTVVSGDGAEIEKALKEAKLGPFKRVTARQLQ